MLAPYFIYFWSDCSSNGMPLLSPNKQGVVRIIEIEMKRFKNDPDLQHLVQGNS